MAGERARFQKNQWASGELAHFEYHCNRAHNSADAELWYRDHQIVTVLGDADSDRVEELDTLEKRGEAGMPLCYRVRFADGFEGCAVEDELFTSQGGFDSALGPPPAHEIAAGRAAIKNAETGK
jgi:hypothetical protein